ncbi:glycosyltransferase [Streptomyces albipurpureus]|uniref:D-inositol 3-phosphate glycosyltransferase n=1 Tax=Streptomyces albipurpureus TaxID=2897419 RepID=A0ABT0ULF7_9ACTN|nr:glycosyltransferase [Streptomyces sp. CWNU-1]MCM2389206.1 glycosyltransferase [Streptomyces sp. CWNU-1]
MRVLHVITGLDTGGAEQQLRLLLRRLPLRCDVVTLTNPGVVADGLRSDGVEVTHLGMGGNRDLAALPRLTRLIRRGRYDIVHTHLYRACVYGRLAARFAGVRTTIATEHSLGAAEIEGRPLTASTRTLYRGTERLGSATVAVSETVAGRLRAWGVPAERIHIVPNGIEAARFRYEPLARLAERARLGIAPTEFVVGGVGRLVPGKRFDLLVRAVAALPDVQLLIAGDGPERNALNALAEQLGAGERVRLLGECDGDGRTEQHVGTAATWGPRPAVADVLSALDVFVSTSREEAFGLAAVEALAAGLPVLHGPCPAIDDLPAHQSPGALRLDGTLDQLIGALRRQLAAGQRRQPPPAIVGHYDIARSGDLLMDVYTRTLARSAPRYRTNIPYPPPTERART